MSIEYLRAKLASKQDRIDTRYKYYEMKNYTHDFGISTPPQLQWVTGTLGWCSKAVDSLANRLSVKGIDNDNFNLWEIFQMNSADVFFRSAIVEALIGSCSFVYISADEEGEPRLQVIDARSATGIIDPITQMLTEGYAVLDRDEYGKPITEAYFEPGQTTFYKKTENGNIVEVGAVKTACKYPMLVPLIYRPDTKRPFGHSRISRACMSLQDSAIRTIKRSEISAEFYSFPQKYVTGVSEDAEGIDKWKASMSSLLILGKDEDGGHPIPGQFQTQSQTPHLEQLRLFASLFGGEAGLTLDDLGFASGNPSSADAIKSAHENLRLTARDAQNTFGVGLLNVGICAASLKDDMAYKRKAFYNSSIMWNPVFEPDGTMLSGLGDAAIKINQAIPDYLDNEKLSKLIGI